MSSMTDLMTSLAVIFILLLVVYLNRTYINTNKQSDNIKSKIEQALKKQNIPNLKNDPLDPLSLIIRLRDDKLSFNKDQFDIKDEGKKYLQEFIPNLIQVICSNKDEIESVLVQGFTDSKTGSYEHNLILSQNRAFEVLKYSLNNTNLTKEQKDCFVKLTSTNGKGSTDLLPFDIINQSFAEPGFENENDSRRVEFKIRVKSYEQRKKIKRLNKQKNKKADNPPYETASDETLDAESETEETIDKTLGDEQEIKANLEKLLGYKKNLKNIFYGSEMITLNYENLTDNSLLEKYELINSNKYNQLLTNLYETRSQMLELNNIQNPDTLETRNLLNSQINTTIQILNDYENCSRRLFDFLIINNYKFKKSSKELKFKNDISDSEKQSLEDTYKILYQDYINTIIQLKQDLNTP